MNALLSAFLTLILLMGGRGLATSYTMTFIDKGKSDLKIVVAESLQQVAFSARFLGGSPSDIYGAEDMLLATNTAYPDRDKSNTSIANMPEVSTDTVWAMPVSPISMKHDMAGNVVMSALGTNLSRAIVRAYNVLLLDLKDQMGFVGDDTDLRLDGGVFDGNDMPSIVAHGDFGHPGHTVLMITREDGGMIQDWEFEALFSVGPYPGGEAFTFDVIGYWDPTIVIPEPASYFVAGIAMIAALLRRRR